LLGKISQLLEKLNKYITGTLCYIAMGAALGLMFIGAVDVIARYLLNIPIKAAYGLSEIMLLVIVFFGWAYTLSVGGHVRVDTIISRISRRAQAIIGLGTSSLALVIFGLMVWRSALKAIASSQGYEVIDVIKIPVYPFQFLVSVGSFSLCLELTVQIFHFLARLRKGS